MIKTLKLKNTFLTVSLILLSVLHVFAQDIDEIKKLVGTGGTFTPEGDMLGRSVAIDGEWAVAGAPDRSVDVNTSIGTTGSGGITIYRKNTGSGIWSKYKDIYSPVTSSLDFGISVSISGDDIVVGCHAGSQGGAFIYSKDVGGTDNWGYVKRIRSSDWVSNDQFGHSVSISDTTIVVGAQTPNFCALTKMGLI